MLADDLIVTISNYNHVTNLKFLDSDIYGKILLLENHLFWQNKQHEYLNKNNIHLPHLTKSNSWKHEFMRIINYDSWHLFQENNINKICVDNGMKIKMEKYETVPKEVFGLINLTTLIIKDGNDKNDNSRKKFQKK